MYNFDVVPERRGTNSIKWDRADEYCGGKNLLPMWIADMDFAVAPSIIGNLRKKVDQSVFGYTFLSDEYYNAVIHWMKTRHNFDVEKEEIVFTPGVVPGLDFAIQALTQPGDDVLVEVPVYGPFYKMIEKNGCNTIETPLINDSEYYTFDFEDLESKITDKTKVFMLCSPHNPSGRVWKREELMRLAEICERHNIFVISDEIHNDLILEGEHIVFATLNDWAAQHTITCTAPTKTFNLASVIDSNIIIKNKELRETFKKICDGAHCSSSNCFVEPIIVGAYMGGAQWLNELLVYIKANRDYVCRFIAKNIPEITVHPMEGTYLAWLNCEKLGLRGDSLKDFIANKCGLGMNNGAFFGQQWDGYCRMNLACTRDTVSRACDMLAEGIASLKK
ncbi:MAG: MalY/PatB family protein [Clostridiaceae bacterium]|nr:MalY/PatB family protein [Clostridiaceae bacterium]